MSVEFPSVVCEANHLSTQRYAFQQARLLCDRSRREKRVKKKKVNIEFDEEEEGKREEERPASDDVRLRSNHTLCMGYIPWA